MHGVGPGSLLGGRYRVQRRVSQHSRFERWGAADQTLDREVVLLCFDADGPTAAAGLDAARRAAGVEDHRLVRVLDVGRDDGVAFVVEEPLRGARSVTAILADGGLPAEEARRVVGEAATALETARARGLHHGVLTPRSVLRHEDGTLKIRGLATEAALVDADDVTSEEATRADTVALVGLAYAVLTGRWPLPGGDTGLEAAPRVAGGVAPPSEIAVGVPDDLDLITRTTLNEDRGPATPGQLAEQLAPWSPTPVTGAFQRPPAPRRPGTRTEPLARDRSTGGVARGATRVGSGRTAGPAAAGAEAGAAAGAGAATVAAAGGGRPAPGGRAVGADGSPRSVLGMNVGQRPPRRSGGRGEERIEPLDGRDDRDRYADDEGYEGYEGYDSDEGSPRDRRGRGKAPAAVAGAVGAVGTAAAGAAAGGAAVAKGLGSAIGAVGGRVGGMARGAADRAAERSATKAERRDTEQWQDPLVFGEEVRLSDTLEPTDEQLEPPLPLLPGTAQEPLDRDQSRLVLVVVAVFVVVAAALGIWGLPKLSGIGTSSSSSAPAVTKTVTASPGDSPSAAPTTSTKAPTTHAPIAIASASQISADAGVQAVKNAAQAYDGNPDTFWRSTKWFATPQYGGYEGREMGLLLDLGSAVDVHQVAFTLVGVADVSVFVADQPKVDGATKIGSVTGQDGAVTVSAPNNGSTKGRYVILWFTALGPDGEGHFRAQVAEAGVS